MSAHPLLNEEETYSRYLDVVSGYIEDESKVLSLRTGRCVDICKAFVTKKVEESAIKDVVMKVLRRDGNGDRVKDTVGFLQYLKWINDKGHILAPNMITYAHPTARMSYTAQFIKENLAARSAIKKAGQRAKQMSQSTDIEEEVAAFLEEAYFANLEQGNKKFFNNSASGAGCSEHNPLYYLTKHTSLTSTCRNCTSLANAVNEKLISSNRHYYDFDVTLQNISYIINNADMKLIEEVAYKYKMTIPTVEQLYTLIESSTSLYWKSTKKMAVIKNVIENMTDMERLAVAYVNDMNAICRMSDSSIRDMFDRLINRDQYVTYNEEVFEQLHEDILVLSLMLCYDFMKGLSAKDIKKRDKDKYQLLTNTVGNTRRVLLDYADFIRAFFITDVMPQNIFKVPNMVRKAVPASDTDSSIYTTQTIANWYRGKEDYSLESISAGSIVSFFSSSMVAHGMLKLSKQLNVSDEEKYRIAMKGEFFMSVLLVSNLTKHYSYLTDACEGKIYTAPEMENKGVQLKNSKLPKEITDKSFEWYNKILLAITNMTDMTPKTIKGYIAYLEHTILEHINDGTIEFYSKETVKAASNYKRPESSPFVYIDLWNNSFADKYGEVKELPVTTKKVHVTINSKAKVLEWAETLDPSIKDGMIRWMESAGKDKFGHLLIPQANMPGGKLPKEIIPIIDVRRLLSQITDHAYIYMSMLGIHVKNNNYTNLCSDTMTKADALEEMKKIGLEPFENW